MTRVDGPVISNRWTNRVMKNCDPLSLNTLIETGRKTQRLGQTKKLKRSDLTRGELNQSGVQISYWGIRMNHELDQLIQSVDIVRFLSLIHI